MADNINKTYFDYLRACGCENPEEVAGVVPCSDAAEDVSFNNIGTNYQATNVRNALIEVDGKRVQNGSDILDRVKKTGDSMSGDLVFENPITNEVGRLAPLANGIGIEASTLVTMDTPNVAVSGWSTLIGYTLTVGQDGLIVPVLTTVPELSWNDTDNSGTTLLNQAYTDLKVTATTTEIIDKWEYKAVVTGTASGPLNLTFQLKADGTPIATTQSAVVVTGQAGIAVSFSEVSTYASGTVFTLEAQIDEATGTYTVDFIDFTVNKLSALAGTTWGSITGTLSAQSDLQAALDTKADLSHNHTLLTALTRTQYAPQVSSPTYVEGNAYYNDATKAMHIQGPFEGVEVEVGHGEHVHVVNNTASIIAKGTAVRHNGVAAGTPQVIPAIADSFTNARVWGLASEDIAV